ncbi:hypothetical protein GIB67_014131 [Kingdonia uniflora]|uniref:Uncharacterized protein n=1 Tax=Kingdonia uniflora TaxID=39325 RepID=A0A7J7N402_9MAGN|nr:hypothetical protein GIB67_014131 [Kingdonia uniflora]
MVVLQTMMTSQALFTSSLQLTNLAKQSLITKPFFEIRASANANWRNRRKRWISITSAVATDSTEKVIEPDVKLQIENLEEKIVLPTNDSSENLLRIRHTVSLNSS